MYFMVQYFYPGVMPLYLAFGLAAAATRYRWVAVAAFVPVLVAGVVDAHWIAGKSDVLGSSGIREQMVAWNVGIGTGDYDSTYDIMWANRNSIMLEPMHQGRMPRYRAILDAAPRFVHVYRPGDAIPPELSTPDFKIVERAELKNGYSLELISRTHIKP
jgi:hypothetical protein